MEFQKGKILFEGKTKKVYPTNDSNYLIMHFKNDVADSRGSQKRMIKNKGVYNNTISSVLFNYLEGYSVRTHFVQVFKPNEMVVRKLEIIPVEVVVWNFAVGSLHKRYRIPEGKRLDCPVLEFYLKNDKLRNPMVTIDHACAFGYAKLEEMHTIDRMVRKSNVVLKSFFDRRELKLTHFSLKFGRYDGRILVADELSADTCHFWDMRTTEREGMEFLCFDSDDVKQAYEELKDRICR